MENMKLEQEQLRAVKKELAKKYIAEYLNIAEPNDLDQVILLDSKQLPDEFLKQTEFINDPRSHDILIAVIPDKLWVKGTQPSESSAEHDLILMRQDYLNTSDQIRWLTHEMSHCLRFKDNPELYQTDSQTPAFQDIESEFTYPNNRVEEYTFGRQFELLKKEGSTKDQVIELLKQYYHDEKDWLFLNRLLDRIFS